MAKSLKPGMPAPASGIYDIVGSRGGETGKQVVAERGEPLPPPRQAGQTYKLAQRAKH